jgi:MOSC domain-containing protein YiiM
MDARDAVRLVPGLGVEGSADRGGRRQVSILAREDWEDALLELGAGLDPAARRANVLVSGVALRGAGGRVLALGPCRVRILGELTPCERMDESLTGLEEALRPAWRGGVFGEVLQGGEVHAGDAAWVEPGQGPAAGPPVRAS